jgi:hypothetical protein
MIMLLLLFIGALGQAPPTPAVPDTAMPWSMKVEHRFVWVQSGSKVGETRIHLEEAGGAAAKTAGSMALLLKASRTYDRQGMSQQASSTTTARLDGMVLQYQERLEVSALKGKRAHQETSFEVSGNKLKVTYTRDETRQPTSEVDLPPGSMVVGNQALEHWLLVAMRLPRDGKPHEVQMYYPDFARVLSVTFRERGQEEIKVGSKQCAATRYAFSSKEKDLRGSLWVDSKGRLLQIQFPNLATPELSLTVTYSAPD